MKKTYIFLLIFLCSCNIKKEPSEFESMVNNLYIMQDYGAYSIDLSDSPTTNHSIQIYGQFYDSSLYIENYYQNNISRIELIGDNHVLTIPNEDIEWLIFDNNKNGKNFRIELSNVEYDVEFEDVFYEIIFYHQTESCKIALEHFYIQAFTDERNRISVMESPISFKDVLQTNDIMRYSYYILSINDKIKDQADVSLVYPEEFMEVMEVSNIQVIRDESMEEDIKKDFSSELSEEDKEILRVFQVECSVSIISEENILFQPFLSINADGTKQTIAPLIPMMFFFDQWQIG